MSDFDIDTNVKRFNETIIKHARNNIPNKIVTIRKSDPPWMNNEIQTLSVDGNDCIQSLNELIILTNGPNLEKQEITVYALYVMLAMIIIKSCQKIYPSVTTQGSGGIW